jgi:monofunctional biosynthetic peptidoglycan transglycosylase
VVIAVAAFALVVLFSIYATLPDVRPLARRNPESTAFISLRARQAEARGRPARRVQHWVPYTRISPHLKRAVLVTEDSAFFSHDGIDLEELRKSVEVNLDRLAFARGGSTITQQLAKNLYLSPSKDPLRKFRELLIARLLEVALTKQRILEIYLNVIEWGDGVYGADAAARAYFGISAAGLSPEQSALLAGAIANPRIMNPGAPSRRLRARQRLIVRRMGYGTREPDPEAASERLSLEPEPASAAPQLGVPVPLPQLPPQGPPDETIPPRVPPSLSQPKPS